MIRIATPADAIAIADLHTRSWRLNYRGAMTDQYLDEEAPTERRAFWGDRLEHKATETLTLVAVRDDGAMLGFCCLVPDAYPKEGYYLDNLHVAPEAQGLGLGRRLMQQAAARLLEQRPDGDIFLWVLTGNEPAISFYAHTGGLRGREETLQLAGNEVEAIMFRWRLSTMAAW